MQSALVAILAGYLSEEVDKKGLSRFVASFDWDDTSDAAMRLRAPIGRLELLLEEIGEGLRPDSELRCEAVKLLNAFGPRPAVEHLAYSGQSWVHWQAVALGSTKTETQVLQIHYAPRLAQGDDTGTGGPPPRRGFAHGLEATTSDPERVPVLRLG